MSRLIHKSHNLSVLLYHAVFPSKYRRVVFDTRVDAALRDVCWEIARRYEIEILEIGTDEDHVHFLLQSVPTYSPTRIMTILKSITAREVLRRCPHVKKQLWNSNFWSEGYFVSTVGPQGNENTIAHYVREQGIEQGHEQIYHQLYLASAATQASRCDQLTLFSTYTSPKAAT